MRNLVLNFLLILSVIFSGIPVQGALSEVDKSQVARSLVMDVNGGFENGFAGWTKHASDTWSLNTTAGQYLGGRTSLNWNSGASGRYLTSKSVSVNGFAGRNGWAKCSYQVPSGTTTHTFEVTDGTNILNSTTYLTSATTFHDVVTNFVFPASGSVNFRFKSNADEPEIRIDDCEFGDQGNLFQVSQASLFGTAIQQGNTSTTCLFTENSSTATNNFVTLGTGSGCDAWTTTGNVGVTGTNSHSITIAQMPPGEYLFEVSGIFQSDTASQSCYWRITDGTSGLSDVAGSFHANVYETSTSYLRGNYSVTTALTSKTFSIQAADDGAGICRLHNGITTGSRIAWKVWKYPTSNQIGTSAESTLTELVKYTPTFAGFGTVADVNIWSRRVGDSLEVSGYFQAGTVAASTATMTLGFNGVNGNVTIDTAKTAYGVVVGSAVTNQTASGTGPFSWSILTQSPGTLIGFGIQTSTVSSGAPSNGNVFAATGNYVHVNFKVPITGWKSSVPVPVYIGSVTAPDYSGATKINTVKTVTSDYTVTANDETILVNTTGGIITITLPSATGFKGKKFIIQPTATTSNYVQLSYTGGGYGVPSRLFSYNQQTTIYSDGTTWRSTDNFYPTSAEIRFSAGVPSVWEQNPAWITSLTDGGTGIVTINTNVFSGDGPWCTCSTKEQAVSGSACMVTSATDSAIIVRLRDLAGTLADEHFFINCRGQF